MRCLQELELPVIAVSGLLTASPLATREAAAVLEVPVIGAAAMNEGEWLPAIEPPRAQRPAARQAELRPAHGPAAAIGTLGWIGA